jgi:hypothetical protein
MPYTSQHGAQIPGFEESPAAPLGKGREKGPGVPVDGAETDVAQNGQGEADEAGFVRGVRFEDFKGLRTKAHKADQAAKELAEAKNRIAVLETGLKLSPLQTRALFAAHEGEINADALRATAVDLGFAEPPDDEEPEEDKAVRSQAQKVQGVTAGASPPGKGALLSAADVTGWNHQRIRQFMAEHPDLYQTMLRDPSAKVTNPGGAW